MGLSPQMQVAQALNAENRNNGRKAETEGQSTSASYSWSVRFISRHPQRLKELLKGHA